MVGHDGQRRRLARARRQGAAAAARAGPEGDLSQARDINDAGVVVGDGATRPGNTRNRAFTWTEAGGMRRLDTLGFEKTGNLSLLKNKGLTINGRKVGKKGA